MEKFKKVAEAAKLNLKEEPVNEMDENASAEVAKFKKLDILNLFYTSHKHITN